MRNKTYPSAIVSVAFVLKIQMWGVFHARNGGDDCLRKTNFLFAHSVIPLLNNINADEKGK